MIPSNVYFSKELFIAALCIAAIALLYTFGGQIIKDARSASLDAASSVTPKEVSRYFMEQGYIVCKITPVKNTNKWLAFLIRNGEYVVATVFTNGKAIQGHQHSIS
jgi:hypothetical protein